MKWFLCLATFFVFLLPSVASAAPVKDTLEIGGWLPYWRAASSTQDVLPNLSVLTTVHPFAFSVATDGTLVDTLTITEEPWKSFIVEAQTRGVRVIPSILWTDGAAMHRVLSNQETRIQLEDDIVALVKTNGWDGIDIDFEAKYAETKDYFSTFLRGLYQRMGKKWVYCTIESRTPLSSRYDTVPANIEYANDYVEINKYCDRVQIMAYDQGSIDIELNRATAGPYAPIADVRWVEKVMREAMKTISPRKLVIGVPTYGYEYQAVPRSGGGFYYNRLWAFNPRYALDVAVALGITPFRTPGGELQMLYLPENLEGKGEEFDDVSSINLGVPTNALSNVATAPSVRPVFNIMTWGDATSVIQKVALAKRLGLKGVVIFKLDGGQDPNIWNILWGR